MKQKVERSKVISRRAWFERMAGGLYGAALTCLFRGEFGNSLESFASEASGANAFEERTCARLGNNR